jgi:hypothetical protein
LGPPFRQELDEDPTSVREAVVSYWRYGWFAEVIVDQRVEKSVAAVVLQVQAQESLTVDAGRSATRMEPSLRGALVQRCEGLAALRLMFCDEVGFGW